MARLHLRRHLRVDTVGQCFVQLGDGWEGSVLNLSSSGLLLRLRRVLRPGSSYILKLLFENQTAVVEARVVRLASIEEECLMGMQFLSMSQDDAARLRGYLHR